jgi:hypothetical protein
MPTLPGRETSILAVLASHDTRSPDAAPTFDWRTLVQEARPGGATEGQRQQAARFARIRQDVQRWADALGVSHEHLEESSFYAVACTPPGAAHEQAVALAVSVYWIYLLDDFLDRRDFASLAAESDRAMRAALDRELLAILAPLIAIAAGRAPRNDVAGTPSSPGDAGEDTAMTADTLRAALVSVLTALEVVWRSAPGGERAMRSRRLLIAREFAACAAAMRREIGWNTALAHDPRDPRLPAFADYLAGGAVSIGMPAVAAVVASFEAEPDAAWSAGRDAIAAGGRVVRLTNDLHTYFADIAEGKVSAITLRLRELGYAPDASRAEAGDEVHQAQASVGEDLAREVAAFGRACGRLRAGPLGHCIRHAVAFALAVYGDGSQFRRSAA